LGGIFLGGLILGSAAYVIGLDEVKMGIDFVRNRIRR
jgi:hypothetical protein